MKQKQELNSPASATGRNLPEKRSLHLPLELHKRLKVKAIMQNKLIHELAAELIEKQLKSEGAG